MIEPRRDRRRPKHDRPEIRASARSAADPPGSLAIWWLGQSGFLIKSRRGMLVDRPVPLRAPDAEVRGHGPAARPDDPGAASRGATCRASTWSSPPQALRPPRPGDAARPAGRLARCACSCCPRRFSTMPRRLGLPAERLVGIDAGDVVERAGFRVRAVPSAHERLDRDEQGRHLYLGYVIETEGLRLYHSGDSLAYDGLAERAGAGAVRRALPADQRPRPGAGRAGQHDGGRGRGPGGARSGPGSSCRITTICSPSIRFRSRRSRPRPAGCRRGSSPGSCDAASAGRSRRERHAGDRIGTSGTKTLAIDERGTILASASAEYPCAHPRAGLVRAGPRALVGRDDADRPGRCWPRASSSRPTSPGSASPGRCTARSSSTTAGEVIRPALLWNDQRTAAECREIEERAGGREALVRMVANPALTGFTAPKLLWVRKHEPKNWDRVRQVLLPKDYIRYRLTGTYATEVSDASGHAPARRRQPPLEPRAAGQARHRPALSAAVLREPRGLGQGERGWDRRRPGLPVGTPVVGGGGDQPAGAVGNGIVRQGVVSATMGTSGVVFAHADQLGFDPLGRLQRGCHAVPGAWHVMGVVLVGRRQLPVVPQRAGQGRGRAGQAAGRSTPTSCSPPRRRSPARGPRGSSSCPT